MNKIKIISAKNHLQTVLTHKKWVFYYCCKAGIPLQGLVHDLSEFSPTEFMESINYYTGTHSSIDECKKKNGVSYAWMHHKGRNPHHYEYWQDNFDKGGQPIKMPYKYAVELLCDYLGDGRAYQRERFTYKGEYEWWLKKRELIKSMHPHTFRFVDKIFSTMMKYESDGKDPMLVLRKRYTKHIYRSLDYSSSITVCQTDRTGQIISKRLFTDVYPAGMSTEIDDDE